MNSRESDALARRVTQGLESGDAESAYAALKPVLEERTPFRILDRIGTKLAKPNLQETGAFLDLIAIDGTEGGWVVIGSILRAQYDRQPVLTIRASRRYIIAADSWYGADILGERVPGPALVEDYDRALPLLASWRSDGCRWVRRAVGVAVHFWAKRSRGNRSLAGQAAELLEFLAPMFGEWDMDAVKGVGWGLKTLGRYYPQAVAGWLLTQIGRPYRRLMLRKATTYLTDEQRQIVLKAYGL